MLWCLACALESVFLIDELVGGSWLVIVFEAVALFRLRWRWRLREVLLVPVEKAMCCLLGCVRRVIADQLGCWEGAVCWCRPLLVAVAMW